MFDLNPASSWPTVKEGTCARLLSPAGLYPSRVAFRTPEAAIVVTPGVIALVTRFSPVPPPEEYFHSEVEFLSAFEVRALAATILSRRHETGAMSLYPVVANYVDLNANLDLSKVSVLRGLLGGLLLRLAEDRRQSAAHVPPCSAGQPYDFNEYSEIDRRRFGQLLRTIDVEDHLLIRGLGALIEAGMLSCHQEFLEHACMALWVSLDASFRILLREMRKSGYVNPTAKDAGEFLDDVFDNEYDSGGFFADFYEERMKTIHPESRFGVYPAAPLNFDEYYQLEASLRPLYEFLITGHVDKALKVH